MKKNLELWEKVAKTDPKYTKKVTSRGGFTSISSQYQKRQATEHWGEYGNTWGVKDIEIIELAGKVSMKAVFFYPDGAFELIRGPVAISDDCLTKLQTSFLSKALSYLGFGADVFLGNFDVIEYQAEQLDESVVQKCNTVEELQRALKDLPLHLQKEPAVLQQFSKRKAQILGTEPTTTT